MPGTALDVFWFAILPYLALFSLVIGSSYRYFVRPFSVSALSSQFLENRLHFWAQVPFHYGIIVVAFGHVLGVIFPGLLLRWNADPQRLFALEAVLLAFALLALLGIVGVMVRRVIDEKCLVTTTRADWLLYALLFFQIVSGIGIAVLHGWGSSWFASVMSPYLRSLALGYPAFLAIAALPVLVKAHVVCALLIALLLPFTRLIHVLVAPFHYLGRKPQLVRWYRNPAIQADR